MFFRYYEKVVKERISRGMRDEVREGIGSYMRAERLKQGLKQINVCQGVCSVSYYSRIERNQIKPSLEHIQKFFSRLNQSIPEEFIINRHYERKIFNQYFQHLAYEEYDDMEKMIATVKTYPPLLQLMQLLLVNAQQKVDEAKEILKTIYNYRDTLSDLELLTLLYGMATYYYLNDEYELSKQYLDLSFLLKVDQNILLGFIHYLYAKVMSRLKNSFLALKHIEDAMDYFSKQCVYHFIIRGEIFVAIELAKHYPCQAITQFKHLLASQEVKSRKKYYIHCQFWLAYTYIRLKQYDQALKLFRKLKGVIKDYPFVGAVYAHLLYLCNDQINAKQLLNDLKKREIPSQRLRHVIIHIEALLSTPSCDHTISLLEDTLIPFAIKERDQYLEWEWRMLAIQLLEEKCRYQDAISHYKALLEKFSGLSII